MIKCIAFDMDDTLYDEADYYKSGFSVIADKIAKDFSLNAKDVFEKMWELFSNGTRKDVFNTAAEKLGLKFDEQYIKLLVSVFREHKPDIILPADTRQVLTDSKKRYKLGLITDGWLPGQEYKVKALGIESFFDSIIYTEKLGTQFWKPSPKGFEKLLADLKINATEAVYVGDNLEKDFIAPNRMGYKTIRLVRSKGIHTSSAASKDAEAQYEIDSITKLNDLLNKFNV
jgi:putative hydrolase of the HAD superfamily